EVVLEQREREIHTSRDARGGRDPAVAYVDAVGLDTDTREHAREVLAIAPVRGRPAAVEQPRAREQERAAADRGRASRARVGAPDPVDRRSVEHGAGSALATGYEQGVDGTAQVTQRPLRYELEPRRHAHRPGTRRDELHAVARITALDLGEQARGDREHLER